MASGPWWWKWPRWMGDGGAQCGTSSSISSFELVLFFFLRWITSFLLKLLSNWLNVDVCSQTGGMSCGAKLSWMCNLWSWSNLLHIGHCGTWATLVEGVPIVFLVLFSTWEAFASTMSSSSTSFSHTASNWSSCPMLSPKFWWSSERMESSTWAVY